MGVFKGVMTAVEASFDKHKAKKKLQAQVEHRQNIREKMINLFPTLPHRSKKPLYDPKDPDSSQNLVISDNDSNASEEEKRSFIEEEDGEYVMGPTDYRFSADSN